MPCWLQIILKTVFGKWMSWKQIDDGDDDNHSANKQTNTKWNEKRNGTEWIEYIK